MTTLQQAVAQGLAANGILAQGIKGFQPRQVQQQLAAAICQAIEQQQTLVAEAGTGIGKTFAYLLPALLSGRKTVVSTGSKNLQDQLFFKDLPTILAQIKGLLPANQPLPKIALLKGRRNYLCHYHLQLRLRDLPKDEQTVDHLMRLRAWASGTQRGDFAEVTSVPEDAIAFRYASASRDNCLGRRCPDFERCCLKKARDEAQQAQLVVINHHLFFADAALKQADLGTILPSSTLFIFDEAHQLPDVALSHYSEIVSGSGLDELSRGLRRLYQGPLRDCADLMRLSQQLNDGIRTFNDALSHEQRDWRQIRQQPKVAEGFQVIDVLLQHIVQLLGSQLSRDQNADKLYDFAVDYQQRLQAFCQPTQDALMVDKSAHHFVLRRCPLSVAGHCRTLYQLLGGSWIFTSATLTVANQFQHFTQAMGLQQPQQLLLDSPFDYQRQALLCVPRGLPEPSADNAAAHLAQIAEQLIEAADGRTFLLFTSLRMMHQVGQILVRRVSQPLLVQGQGSKRLMLQKFTLLGNAVLLGSYSFWEGIDVRGQALSCVIIDKLPFAPPDDPLIKARSDAALRRHGDPFNDVLLPQAVIALKQGLGRLIRGEQDQGVMVICDPRLVSRPYGKLFLTSLPPMARTRELAHAIAKLREL
ncbi:MAG: ATP-dependent DNA helicase [Ferrimonas sp.]